MTARPAAVFRFVAATALTALVLSACAPEPAKPPTQAPPDRLLLTQAGFTDLPGWTEDAPADALPALRRSCARIARLAPGTAIGPEPRFGTAGDWQGPCAALTQAPPDRLRGVLESEFRPLAAANNGRSEGLFTGYYEPTLKAARQRGPGYAAAILARPDDLVMVELGQFREALKGQRIAGRLDNGRLVPYPDRAAIEGGALAGRAKPLYWAADPVDLFFMQIQGSGRLDLSDGRVVRVGYDGQNGHPYVAIGKVLRDRGALPKDGVTMQSIRAWLKDHPGEAAQVMNQNPSYVFFKELTGDGPLGAEGVALTPGRSLAVDRKFWALGLPVWLDTTLPARDDGRPATPFRRLLVAQDTGGAITGPVRGDVFWGAGAAAAELAGKMQQPGRLWVLMPTSLAAAAGG